MKPTPRIARVHRWRLVAGLEKWLEPAMVILGVVWLLLLVVEFIRGLAPWLQHVSTGIWLVFLVDFAVRLAVAPRKGAYLARNWLTLISLALPAFRVLRIGRALRLLRATRGLRLVRLLTSLNRGLRSVGAAMGARGAGYVGLLTIVIVVAGAAGMFVFEGAKPAGAFNNFGEALWWTAMLVTTLGSDYWPQTAEGRILSLLLSIYAVGVFGYLAAALASVFVGRAAQSADENGSIARELRALREEVKALRMQRSQ